MISIHALREEGDEGGEYSRAGEWISIHALREEGDLHQVRVVPQRRISIHALREEGDLASTPSAAADSYFYPRPPRGGRLRARSSMHSPSQFLSTPSARRATQLYAVAPVIFVFLSTPSARRATDMVEAGRISQEISIHALREEGDELAADGENSLIYFYPRPPRGGRRIFVSAVPIALLFLSTPSARRATSVMSLVASSTTFLSTPSARRATEDLLQRGRVRRISIHALREEGDKKGSEQQAGGRNFYPRPPRGGRLFSRRSEFAWSTISIHALREEGDYSAGTNGASF